MCLLGQGVITGSELSGEGGISGSKFDIEIFQCPNEETNKGRLGFGSQKISFRILNFNIFWKSEAHEEEALWKNSLWKSTDRSIPMFKEQNQI